MRARPMSSFHLRSAYRTFSASLHAGPTTYFCRYSTCHCLPPKPIIHSKHYNRLLQGVKLTTTNGSGSNAAHVAAAAFPGKPPKQCAGAIVIPASSHARACRCSAAAAGSRVAPRGLGCERAGVRASGAAEVYADAGRYLHHAARAGCIGCARVLLWGRADVEASADCGGMGGCSRARDSLAGPLSAAVDARDRWFRTALQWAVRLLAGASAASTSIAYMRPQVINGHVAMASLLVFAKPLPHLKPAPLISCPRSVCSPDSCGVRCQLVHQRPHDQQEGDARASRPTSASGGATGGP